MKTAMQELIDFLEPELKMGDFLQLPAYEKAKQLLEKEKKQIINAHDDGIQNPYSYSKVTYYNETFNSEP